MINKLKSKQGFTLVELLVVVMVISLLALIAIPTFLNQRKKAQDADTKSSIRNSMETAMSLSEGKTGWSNDDLNTSNKLAISLNSDQSAYTYIPGVSPESNDPHQVNVVLSNDKKQISLISKSRGHEFICVKTSSDGQPTWAMATSIADCTLSTGGPDGLDPDEPTISMQTFSDNTSKFTRPSFDIGVTSGNSASCSVDGGASTAATGSGSTLVYRNSAALTVGSHTLSCTQTSSVPRTSAAKTLNFSIANLPMCGSTWNSITAVGINYFDDVIGNYLSSDGGSSWNNITPATSQKTAVRDEVANNVTSLPCLIADVAPVSTCSTYTTAKTALVANEVCVTTAGNAAVRTYSVLMEGTSNNVLFANYYATRMDDYDPETGDPIIGTTYSYAKTWGCNMVSGGMVAPNPNPSLDTSMNPGVNLFTHLTWGSVNDTDNLTIAYDLSWSSGNSCGYTS